MRKHRNWFRHVKRNLEQKNPSEIILEELSSILYDGIDDEDIKEYSQKLSLNNEQFSKLTCSLNGGNDIDYIENTLKDRYCLNQLLG